MVAPTDRSRSKAWWLLPVFGLVILALGAGIWAGLETEELEDLGLETEELEDLGLETEDMEALEQDLSALEQELEQDLSGLASEHAVGLVGLAGVEPGDVEALERALLALGPGYWEDVEDLMGESARLEHVGLGYLLDLEPGDLSGLSDFELEYLEYTMRQDLSDLEDTDQFYLEYLEYVEGLEPEYWEALEAMSCDELEREISAGVPEYQRAEMAGEIEGIVRHIQLIEALTYCADVEALERDPPAIQQESEQDPPALEPEEVEGLAELSAELAAPSDKTQQYAKYFGLEYLLDLEPGEVEGLSDFEREYLKAMLRFMSEEGGNELASQIKEYVDYYVESLEQEELREMADFISDAQAMSCSELEREISAELPQFKRGIVMGDFEGSERYLLLFSVAGQKCITE